MGKSGKPDIEYRFFGHAKYVEGFIGTLGLENITLVMHDWGSVLGFYYAMHHENNVKGLAFMEALLTPFPRWESFPTMIREVFQAFRTPEVGWDMIVDKNMFVGELLPTGVVRKLSEAELCYYREPFKNPRSRAPVWRWPNEISIGGRPPDVVEIFTSYGAKLQQSDLPKLLFYATPGLSPSDRFRTRQVV